MISWSQVQMLAAGKLHYLHLGLPCPFPHYFQYLFYNPKRKREKFWSSKEKVGSSQKAEYHFNFLSFSDIDLYVSAIGYIFITRSQKLIKYICIHDRKIIVKVRILKVVVKNPQSNQMKTPNGYPQNKKYNIILQRISSTLSNNS